jgi:hypothetical protein
VRNILETAWTSEVENRKEYKEPDFSQNSGFCKVGIKVLQRNPMKI